MHSTENALKNIYKIKDSAADAINGIRNQKLMQTKANASKDRCNPKADASKGNCNQQHIQSNADAFKD